MLERRHRSEDRWQSTWLIVLHLTLIHILTLIMIDLSNGIGDVDVRIYDEKGLNTSSTMITRISLSML